MIRSTRCHLLGEGVDVVIVGISLFPQKGIAINSKSKPGPPWLPGLLLGFLVIEFIIVYHTQGEHL